MVHYSPTITGSSGQAWLDGDQQINSRGEFRQVLLKVLGLLNEAFDFS